MTDVTDTPPPAPTVNVVALNTDVAQPGTSSGAPATHMVTLSNGTNLFFNEVHMPIALRGPDGNIIIGEVEGVEEADLVAVANSPSPPLTTPEPAPSPAPTGEPAVSSEAPSDGEGSSPSSDAPPPPPPSEAPTP